MFEMFDQRAQKGGVYDMMREELTASGVKELLQPEDVDSVLSQPFTGVVFVNSVCGCAAGAARPGFIDSLKKQQNPPEAVTVFAGQDKAATERAREYFKGQPPSSPSFAFFKNGELIGMIHREQIERATAEELSNGLKEIYSKYY
ncbi:hypothetical protein CHS0354_023925 [Potamilus streckersoni]|uniref:BrxA/BrxB family bacilliredoxin n=1 Tax=Potamilus streckersoni TaxID=2493646 RepID=A0AAE0RZ39_9BIVA|nr:hypothetical protein CHS0354_023925 [Potamilus streckersoni]